MYSNIKTAILEGIQTRPIQVEVDISNGMPAFDMVGHKYYHKREHIQKYKIGIK